MNACCLTPRFMTASHNPPPDDSITSSEDQLPKVSPKQKKEEILSAYQDLLERFKSNPSQAKERERSISRRHEESITSKVSQYSTESILKKIGELEMATHEWLGKLVEALGKEVQNFRELQEANAIEEKNLQEIHQIKMQAGTLADLAAAHEEKLRRFDEEMEQKRRQWEREQTEYEYQRDLKRRKEENEYEQRRLAKEQELKTWQERLKGMEEEIQMLRKYKEEFEETKEEAIAMARTEAMESVHREEEVKAQLLAEKTRSEKQIAQHQLDFINQRLSEQEATIARLKKELEIANQGVKDIAIKVIEGGVRLDEQHRGVKSTTREKMDVGEEVQ